MSDGKRKWLGLKFFKFCHLKINYLLSHLKKYNHTSDLSTPFTIIEAYFNASIYTVLVVTFLAFRLFLVKSIKFLSLLYFLEVNSE